MKRLVLSLMLSALFVMSGHAGDCVTKRQCLLWSDLDRFYVATKIFVVAGDESQQLLERIAADVKDGVAIRVPPGTRCKLKNEVSDVVYRVEINGVTLFGVADHFKCDPK